MSGESGRLKGLLGMSPVSDHCRIPARCLLPCLKVVQEAKQMGDGVTRSSLYEARSDGPSLLPMHQEALNLLFVAFHY